MLGAAAARVLLRSSHHRILAHPLSFKQLQFLRPLSTLPPLSPHSLRVCWVYKRVAPRFHRRDRISRPSSCLPQRPASGRVSLSVLHSLSLHLACPSLGLGHPHVDV